MSVFEASPAATPRPLVTTRRPMTAMIVRWELRKLASQKRTYLGLGLAVLFPLIFVVVEHVHQHHDHGAGGNLYFSHVAESGLVTPVVALFVESLIVLPLIVALVAGDIVAAEDSNGTLKTILTRSADRGQVLAAKTIAAAIYAFGAIYLTASIATVAGVISWGFRPVITFSDSVVSAPKGLLLVVAAYGCYLIPVLALVSIGILLSTVTRNSAAAVVGTVGFSILLLLVPVIPGLEGTTPYLLTTQYSNWHGLLQTPTNWAPIWHSLWVCALYAAPALLGAYLVFLRRDVAGG
jgi:ABC-2 type transport system permease protein